MDSPGRRRARFTLAAVLVCAVATTLGVAAFGGSVGRLRTVDGHVRAALELRDLFNDGVRRLLEQGGPLHVRVEAALWEDRVWDRPLEPPRVTVFRIARQLPGTQIAVVDPGGGTATYPAYPDPLTIDVDLGAADTIDDDSQYYVSAEVTVGVLTDDAVEETNDALFGRDDGSPGLKSIGRFLLNTVLQISDYVRSETVTIRGRRVRGAQVRSP
jgi:hypothetical protein